MAEISRTTPPFSKEWTFTEDPSGVVYCLGKQSEDTVHEAVAVYQHVLDGSGAKQSLTTGKTYDRIMYHGFPEERSKLQTLRPEIRDSILGKLSLQDHCIYIDSSNVATNNSVYTSIEHWRSRSDVATAQFREALERTCLIACEVGIQLACAQLYGGASFGLVGSTHKLVDDVDLLLSISSHDLYASAQELQTTYTWADIDPNSVLSSRRMLLKAKRWSTSQIRVLSPTFLTVDLKSKRRQDVPSMWEDLPAEPVFSRYDAELKVLDDREAYCISPAIKCEDRKGVIHTVLFRGYPYIGCAVENDIIAVRGNIDFDTGTVLVTQAAADDLVPDFSNVALDSKPKRHPR